MDKLIERMSGVPDADLIVCDGVAYQRDMAAGRVAYDVDYLAKCRAYEGGDIARAVNAGRCALLARHLPDGAAVLDIGAGSGAFVRDAASWGFLARGFDVIPETAQALRDAGVYAEDVSTFEAVTLWDVLEHIEDPGSCLGAVRHGAILFASVPIFGDLALIRQSRHYRPGEHLYYWTASGFIRWMAGYGFRLLEVSTHETDAGRDSIGAFAFCRDLAAVIGTMLPCKCGNDPQLERFAWPRRPDEHFVRCWGCESIGPAVATPDEAVALWNKQVGA